MKRTFKHFCYKIKKVLREKHVNIESKSLELTIYYIDVKNMKLLAVVTLSYIYHCCSTRKTFWEEKLTLVAFTPVKMKQFGHHNFRKHR